MTSRSNKPVVVGVDGASPSYAALEFALEEGLARNTTVLAVTTWTFGTTLKDAEGSETYEELEAEAEAQLATAVALALATTDAHPAVEQRAVHGPSGQTLVEAAQDATVLVVGTGHKGPLTRTFLGSTSEYCVRHAQVPVAVVPDRPVARTEGV